MSHFGTVQELDQRTLRKCPRCGCGLLLTSLICEYCGGVLSHIAAVGDEVSGVVCSQCGEQNDPTAVTCRSCTKPLLHSCPRCDESLAPDASWCPKCGLPRAGFFEECVRQDVAARATEARKWRRFAVADNIVATAVVAIFILVAWWQQLRSDAWEWKVWLAVTVWHLVMWAFAKSR